MFSFLLLSIVIVPVLLGMKVATGRSEARGFRMLLAGWILFGAIWLCVLYYVERRWVG